MKNSFMALASAVAMASVPMLYAQEEDASEQQSATTQESGAEEEKARSKPVSDKLFLMLPLCRVMEGGSEVLRPGATEWTALEEGKFYPLGCAYRTTTEKSRLSIQFGEGCEVEIEGKGSFSTRVQAVGSKERAVILKSGTIRIQLPRGAPEGLFKVMTPGFTVSNLAGESLYSFEGEGDGDSATVRCVTGSLSVEGRHFTIPTMHAANEVRIRTSQDMLFTGLYGTSGDYVVRLDQGVTLVHDVVANTDKTESGKLDWHLSPKTAVRIHRAKPKIGSRLSVTVMTFDETGALVNRCAFAEGRPEINTGEQGEKALAAKEESAKRAMESADAVTTEAAPEAASTEEKATTTEESTEE